MLNQPKHFVLTIMNADGHCMFFVLFKLLLKSCDIFVVRECAYMYSN